MVQIALVKRFPAVLQRQLFGTKRGDQPIGCCWLEVTSVEELCGGALQMQIGILLKEGLFV